MRIVIVDDEPLARGTLVDLCRDYGNLEVVAEADSGAAALRAIRTHSPELVLMDVELQDMTGFDVLRRLDGRPETLAIMITGHAQHAVEAFEVQALDYLTKPVDAERFNQAIGRAQRRGLQVRERTLEDLAGELREAMNAGRDDRTAAPRLLAEKARKLYFLDADTVDYIESNGNYVNIQVGEDRYIARNSLKILARTLAYRGFVRIERSLLLNLRRVVYAERHGRGEFAFMMPNGRQLISSRAHRRAIVAAVRSNGASPVSIPH